MDHTGWNLLGEFESCCDVGTENAKHRTKFTVGGKGRGLVYGGELCNCSNRAERPLGTAVSGQHVGLGAQPGAPWPTGDLSVRCLLGGLRRGHAQLGQEAAVVGLHPFLGQPALVVVPEGTDHLPL